MVTLTKTSATPKRLKMSYQEYLEQAPESHIVEWSNEEAIVYMPPIYTHQDILRFLSNLLNAYNELFDLGKLCFAPFEVKLWPGGPAREPDIFFIGQPKLPQLTPQRFEGAPDLIVEIISTSSVTEDKVKKFNEYEQAGVREYWLIDPRPHKKQVDVYTLASDGAYEEVAIREDGCYESAVLPGFWFNPTWLWQSQLPPVQFTLADIARHNQQLSPELRQIYEAFYCLLQP